jgi:hypothetical protein
MEYSFASHRWFKPHQAPKALVSCKPVGWAHFMPPNRPSLVTANAKTIGRVLAPLSRSAAPFFFEESSGRV